MTRRQQEQLVGFDAMFEHMLHIELNVTVDYANSSTNNHFVVDTASSLFSLYIFRT